MVFQTEMSKSSQAAALLRKLNDGTGTYEDASDLSRIMGNCLAKAYQKYFPGQIPPEGLSSEFANDVIGTTLRNNYNLAAEASREAQENLNNRAGIGLSAKVPEINRDRVDGICKKAIENSQKDEDLMLRMLSAATENYTMSVVDDSVKQNAEYQFRAGLIPKIIRKANGFKPCKWCQSLSGTYEYPDVPGDVYRRHGNCYCTVTYTPAGSKKTQDVWSKKWGKEKEFQKEQRIKAYANQRSAVISGGKQYHPMDPNNPRDVSAAREYRKISRNNDIARIAEKTGFSREDIIEIKRHIFYDKHKKYDGEYGLLVPDYDMAVAWKRLSNGTPEERDIVLLNHELLESKLEKEYNLTMAEAHTEATKKYDWASRLISDLGEKGEPDGLL
jgi:hypothetical protein